MNNTAIFLLAKKDGKYVRITRTSSPEQTPEVCIPLDCSQSSGEEIQYYLINTDSSSGVLPLKVSDCEVISIEILDRKYQKDNVA